MCRCDGLERGVDHTVICPKCGYAKSFVIDTRTMGVGRKRRYECENCHKRFSTFENVIKGKRPFVETNLYNRREVHENCTVEILTNSVTGEISVGWWNNEQH